jgi:hypothetical protein
LKNRACHCCLPYWTPLRSCKSVAKPSYPPVWPHSSLPSHQAESRNGTGAAATRRFSLHIRQLASLISLSRQAKRDGRTVLGQRRRPELKRAARVSRIGTTATGGVTGRGPRVEKETFLRMCYATPHPAALAGERFGAREEAGHGRDPRTDGSGKSAGGSATATQSLIDQTLSSPVTGLCVTRWCSTQLALRAIDDHCMQRGSSSQSAKQRGDPYPRPPAAITVHETRSGDGFAAASTSRRAPERIFR